MSKPTNTTFCVTVPLELPRLGLEAALTLSSMFAAGNPALRAHEQQQALAMKRTRKAKRVEDDLYGRLGVTKQAA